MCDTIKPGATTEDLLDQLEFIDKRGYTIVDGLLHGYGIGILPPSLPGEGYPTTLTRPVRMPGEPHTPFEFAKDMTIVLQPNITTKDGTAGVQLGNLILVTEHGVEPAPSSAIVADHCRGGHVPMVLRTRQLSAPYDPFRRDR
jgi:hypothetical protein